MVVSQSGVRRLTRDSSRSKMSPRTLLGCAPGGERGSSCSPVFIKVMLLNRAFIINVLSGSHIYNCRARGVFAPLSQGYGPSAITRQ
jgi:hypothetical protein